MVQPAGQLVGDMLWLVARHVEKPGVIIRLGSILKDPEDVESSLNLHGIPEIPDQDKRDVSTAVKLHVKTELEKKNSLLVKAVPSLPIFSAGASADGHWNHSASTTVDALDVRATVFIPTDEYMETALLNENVVKYARHPFGRALYIIVGVATASKLSVKEKQSQSKGGGASANFSAPGVVDAGTGTSHEHTAGFESELEVGEECDFAYRVRRFYYSKTFGLHGGDNVTKKAMFGPDRSGPAVVDPAEAMPQFEYFKDEDVSGKESLTIFIPAEDEDEDEDEDE